jgi:hypothetical protein
MNQLESCEEQLAAVTEFFEALMQGGRRLEYREEELEEKRDESRAQTHEQLRQALLEAA